jgi:hypothetical protein
VSGREEPGAARPLGQVAGCELRCPINAMLSRMLLRCLRHFGRKFQRNSCSCTAQEPFVSHVRSPLSAGERLNVSVDPSFS